MDTQKRSIVKAVIWNVIGIISMSVVGILATGSAALGGKMALINTGLGFSMYVIYERIWSRVRWGRQHG
ncbi:DUF2061 domain-containing protein [Shimia sp.]|jgi:uncharacterized membrane protein|uniref:DUF2061 domain-containing protein n=1 Tax=unclassified Shimia TaxID=2630038 RepID=UPI00260115EE|nr:DUF2061 domain-containing protein [Shimia sp.]MCH2068815.1 DUF2061 domain-containing protein [Shimia sp.]MCP4207749.1 DUF2061 domain-containing protein [Shimia sp.]MCP4823903.1 DUF2061 domain-containing protein [Shimia sp.]